MCGIAGILTFDKGAVSDQALLRMAEELHHRGPDESAVWVDGAIGLAHTRLPVIDLAESHQPMHSADTRWVLVFNGEIFNYRQLRQEIDYPFTTDGDTEVLLAGLVTSGISFVERLRGQFSFEAYDRLMSITHLVRDRLGVLPLHYRLDSEQLTFASEIKAVNAALPGPPAVDMDSLDAYLTSRFVPAPNTLFAMTKKLAPGCRAQVDQAGRLTVQRYWSPPKVDSNLAWTDSSAIAAVDSVVRDAVSAALVADVPVGSYLSGGVDSSLITAIMKDLRGGAPVQTFAAGFGDPRYDELPWARQVSERLGTEHHEVHVRPQDFVDLWPRLTWHRDSPLSEPADIAVFRLAQLARQHVTVVLSGEGGDELFAGYPKYRFARTLHKLDRVPASLRRALVQTAEVRLGSRATRARIALRAAGAATETERFQTWFASFTNPERRVLLRKLGGHRHTGQADGVDPIDRMLRFDLIGWLPDNLLERGDRMSMAASVELRPPLLDHKLVELAFSLPSSIKVRGGTTKWILKEVARRYLPHAVVNRRKVGFRVPLDEWFRGDLHDAVWDRLTGPSSFVGETFNQKAVRQLLKRHDSGRFNEEARIWTLMSLQVWYETFFSGEALMAGADAR